jgi:hypothetical protein
MYAYQFWADTTAGMLKMRNATNTAWINFMPLGTSLTASVAELNFCDGVTSAIQTQLTGKVAGSTTSAGKTGTISNTLGDLLAMVVNDVGVNAYISLDGDSGAIVITTTTTASLSGDMLTSIGNSSAPTIILASAAPSSATATGTAGEVRFDDNYIYRCTATDTWKRTALSTWT